MNKRKIILLATALCMVAILAVGGTLAYFTDTDNADNVFTIGHVNIALNEQQRHVVNGQPAHGGALEPFVDNKPLFPIVGSAQGEKDDFGLVKAANYVDKIITIKNLNDSQDAWVRVYLAVPSILDNVNPGLNVLHFNFGNNFATGIYSTADYANWGAETLLTTGYEIDGVKYNIYFRDYNKIMPKNTETGSAAYVGFYLDSKVDYVNPEKEGEMGYYTIDGKEITGLATDAPITIPVFALGVQAAGFDTCAAAMDAAFGNGFNPWEAAE